MSSLCERVAKTCERRERQNKTRHVLMSWLPNPVTALSVLAGLSSKLLKNDSTEERKRAAGRGRLVIVNVLVLRSRWHYCKRDRNVAKEKRKEQQC